MKWLLCLAFYGCLNSLLYVSLLPLWEGFDEPFHYGYVQELSQHHQLPRLGNLHLSREICRSLELAPQSYVVKQNLPWVTTFDAYFKLIPEERARRRSELNNLVSGGPDGACAGNYEAHQAPLAYILLALIDRSLRQSSLPSRVWRLRLICALSSSIGITGALYLLANRLRLPPVAGHSVIFVALSSQMFYATTAHIANDWLAVPLMVLVFDRLIATWENPHFKTLISLAAALGFGLLTKSYFLALVPLTVGVLGILLLRRRVSLRAILTFCAVLAALAGPWYTRNVLLYHNLSGMQETIGGLKLSALTMSVAHLPWIQAGRDLLWGSLWTANNSFCSFSRSTLALVLTGYCAAGAVCAWRFSHRHLSTSERLLLYGCLMYVLALAYSAAVTFWYSGGKVFSPSPWYTQPIIPIISILLFGQLTYSRLHRAIAVWIVMLSAYIIAATYWAKLIPLYGGFPDCRTTLRRLVSWYANSGLVVDRLSVTALRGSASLLLLAAAVAFLAFTLALGLSRRWR